MYYFSIIDARVCNRRIIIQNTNTNTKKKIDRKGKKNTNGTGNRNGNVVQWIEFNNNNTDDDDEDRQQQQHTCSEFFCFRLQDEEVPSVVVLVLHSFLDDGVLS